MTVIWKEYYDQMEPGIQNLAMIILQYGKCRILLKKGEIPTYVW